MKPRLARLLLYPMLAILALWLLSGLWEGRKSAGEREARAAAEAVLALRPGHHAAIRRLREAESRALGSAAAALRRATRSLMAADSAQALADSLQALQVRADSGLGGASEPAAVIGALRQENAALRLVGVNLRGVVEAQQAAIVELGRARLLADARADSSAARVETLEQALNDVLRASRCRILGLIACPSRTVVEVVSIAGGVANGYVAPHP